MNRTFYFECGLQSGVDTLRSTIHPSTLNFAAKERPHNEAVSMSTAQPRNARKVGKCGENCPVGCRPAPPKAVWLPSLIAVLQPVCPGLFVSNLPLTPHS